jgi:glycyl-tRNA synthetase
MTNKYEKVIDLAKRRAFIWSSFEIYGGAAGFYDYGPYGVVLKRKVEDKWRCFYSMEGFSEIETSTLSPEEVFIASGHAAEFADRMVRCEGCGFMERVDSIVNLDKCPECGNTLIEDERNLMFDTRIGMDKKAYLRPETAQGIFIDFNRLLRFHRTLPFGVFQVGKAYRNEISPRQGVLRLREFTLAEAEVFIDPRSKRHPGFDDVKDTAVRLLPSGNGKEESDITIGKAVREEMFQHEYIAYHIARVHQFLTGIGIRDERIRFRQHAQDERAHYASDCWDAEVHLQRGWIEVAGIADRTSHDLMSHSKAAKMEAFIQYEEPRIVEKTVIKPDMHRIGQRFKEKTKDVVEVLHELSMHELERNPITLEIDGETIEIDKSWIGYEITQETVTGENVMPHVVEPSYGIDRIVYVLLEHSLHEEEVDGETRTVLKLPHDLAPVQLAVLPLLNKEELCKKAQRIVRTLRDSFDNVEYDDSGSIGRRYRRQDEIGTPYCITVDHDSLEDDTVTIRDRDTMKQVRVSISELIDVINKR